MTPVYTVERVYPPLAHQARVQGTVRFSLIVSPDGSVKSIQLMNGHPLLVPMAVEAVKQYRYAPSPTEQTALLDINFIAKQ